MLENFLSVALKVMILFLLIGVGFVLGRKKIITDVGSDQMNNLLIYVVIPCIMVDALQIDRTQIPDRNLWFALIAGLLCVLVATVIGSFCFNKQPDGRKQVLKFGAMFSNCGFMGFPMIQEILGDEGMVYGAIINAVITIAMWTIGFVVMRKEGEKIPLSKTLLNPGSIGFLIGLPLMLFSIQIPDPFQSALGFFADMNTPLAMLCVGFFISRTKLLNILREKVLYGLVSLRLLLIPAVTTGILLLFQSDYVPLAAAVIQCCAPSAAMTAVFAGRFRHDTALAAEVVAFSSLLSILTIPLFCTAVQTFYGI